tara:strand:- start:53 stop:364 length:312 start_codon:yes stop_codon:yes gene_type:complete
MDALVVTMVVLEQEKVARRVPVEQVLYFGGVGVINILHLVDLDMVLVARARPASTAKAVAAAVAGMVVVAVVVAAAAAEAAIHIQHYVVLWFIHKVFKPVPVN